ncbi:MAG: hypothetical protein C0592_08365 [Marinilabiliales bacterium]|nr:MAG: hypothetical protein C0592_08365 [Marinilabiliales bacterium]
MKRKLSLLLLLSFMSAFVAFGQCVSFYDGFESGTFASPWANGTGTYTVTVPSTSPAVGTYNLSMASTGSGAHHDGPYATFPASQPTYVSWYMRSDNTSTANGYFVLGDASIASNNGILFCYFNSGSTLRFYASSGYNYPITVNTWYHVEVKDIDWTNKNMDIYIDGALILTDWPFRNTSSTDVSQLDLYSLNAANAEYDDIYIGHPPINVSSSYTDLGCYNDSSGTAGVLATGGDGNFNYFWMPTADTSANIGGLDAGTYTCITTDGNGCIDTQTVVINEPPQIYTDVDTTICAGETWVVGTSTYTTTGYYTDVFPASNSCDSTVYTNLTVADSIDIGTTVTGDTIFANSTTGTYAWVNCDSAYQVIPGETGAWFVPLITGNYAVIVTVGACSDTSDCVYLSPASVEDYQWMNDIRVFPNPTSGMVQITGIQEAATLSLYNAIGDMVLQQSVSPGDCIIDLSANDKGVYLIRIMSDAYIKTLQIIRE